MLEEAVRRHEEVVFFFANQGESAPVIRAYLEEEKVNLPNVIVDPSGQVGRFFGTRALPTTMIFGPDGRVARIHVGEISRAVLDRSLREARRN